MNDKGKTIKIVALFLWAMLTIITCSAVWNSKPDAFVAIMSVLLLAANGYAIYREAKKTEDSK